MDGELGKEVEGKKEFDDRGSVGVVNEVVDDDSDSLWLLLVGGSWGGCSDVFIFGIFCFLLYLCVFVCVCMWFFFFG